MGLLHQGTTVILCTADAIAAERCDFGEESVGQRNAGQVERSVINVRLQNDIFFFFFFPYDV